MRLKNKECPYCKTTDTSGIELTTKNKSKIQTWFCNNCGKGFF